MIFYNRAKIFKVAEGKPSNIVRIFKMLTYDEVPKSRWDPIFKYSSLDFNGTSFMLHPDVLIYNSYKYSNYDVAAYITLASLRSYADYLVNGTLTLSLQASPVDPRGYLENAELIPVKNGVLHFLYEETPHISIQH